MFWVSPYHSPSVITASYFISAGIFIRLFLYRFFLSTLMTSHIRTKNGDLGPPFKNNVMQSLFISSLLFQANSTTHKIYLSKFLHQTNHLTAVTVTPLSYQTYNVAELPRTSVANESKIPACWETDKAELTHPPLTVAKFAPVNSALLRRRFIATG